MKFNCGLSKEERIEKKLVQTIRLEDYYTNWHKHFAWLSVRVGSCDCRWLETVERKCMYRPSFGPYCKRYRAIEKDSK